MNNPVTNIQYRPSKMYVNPGKSLTLSSHFWKALGCYMPGTLIALNFETSSREFSRDSAETLMPCYLHLWLGTRTAYSRVLSLNLELCNICPKSKSVQIQYLLNNTMKSIYCSPAVKSEVPQTEERKYKFPGETGISTGGFGETLYRPFENPNTPNCNFIQPP